MLFIYLMIGYIKNNGLLPRILAGQKKHILSQINLIFAAEKQMRQSPQISASFPNFEQMKVKYVKYERFDK